jgi:hypothetical protein
MEERQKEPKKMKRTVQIGVLTSTACLLMACSNGNDLGEESPFEKDGVNTIEGISMEMEKNVYQAEGDTFELTISNESEEEITYGVEFILEYLEEDTWYEVEPEEDREFILIAHILQPEEQASEELDLSYYEPLEAGEYRVIREFEGEPFAAEFSVEE